MERRTVFSLGALGTLCVGGVVINRLLDDKYSYDDPFKRISISDLTLGKQTELALSNHLFGFETDQIPASSKLGDKLYFYPVKLDVAKVNSSVQRMTVSGDTADLEHFSCEVAYLNKIQHSKQWKRAIKEVGVGFKESAVALFKTIWNTIKNPVEYFKGLKTAAVESKDYIKSVFKHRGLEGLFADLKLCFFAFWENELEDAAQKHGLSYRRLQLPESKAVVRLEARSNIAGNVIFEIVAMATVRFGGAKLVAKGKTISKRKKEESEEKESDEILAESEVLAHGQKIVTIKQRRLEIEKRKKEIVVYIDDLVSGVFEILDKVDEDERMKRLRIVLNYLNDVAEIGLDIHEFTSENLKKAKSRGTSAKALYQERLIDNYLIAQASGAFSSAQNRKTFGRGRPTIIMSGKYKEEKLVFENIVPESVAPMLAGDPINLRLTAESKKNRRAGKIDVDAREWKKKLERAGYLSDV